MIPRGLTLSRIVLAAATATSIACAENVESFYATRPEAGAAEYGRWIPPLLPPSAKNIHECHNIDSSETWGAFEFRPEDTDALRSRLIPIEVGRLEGLRVSAPRRLTWWPSALRGVLKTEALRNSGFEFFAFDEKDASYRLVLALNWGRQKALFLRVPNGSPVRP